MNKGITKTKGFCEKLIRLYVDENKTTEEISRLLDISMWTVYDVLKRHKVKTWRKIKNTWSRKYRIDETFFDIIDNEDKAYFLGLMYADGTTGVNTKGSYFSAIHLLAHDSYLLAKLNKLVYVDDHPLCFMKGKRKHLRKDGRTIKLSPMCSFYVYGKSFSVSLQNKGCVQGKTTKLKFPTPAQVPDYLLHHFIRGFFDGDGSVGYYKNGGRKYGTFVVTVIATPSFITSFRKMILTMGIKPHKIRKQGKVNSLSFAGVDHVSKFRDYIYKDATVWMTRKREKFPKILQSAA